MARTRSGKGTSPRSDRASTPPPGDARSERARTRSRRRAEASAAATAGSTPSVEAPVPEAQQQNTQGATLGPSPELTADVATAAQQDDGVAGDLVVPNGDGSHTNLQASEDTLVQEGTVHQVPSPPGGYHALVAHPVAPLVGPTVGNAATGAAVDTPVSAPPTTTAGPLAPSTVAGPLPPMAMQATMLPPLAQVLQQPVFAPSHGHAGHLHYAPPFAFGQAGNTTALAQPVDHGPAEGWLVTRRQRPGLGDWFSANWRNAFHPTVPPKMEGLAQGTLFIEACIARGPVPRYVDMLLITNDSTQRLMRLAISNGVYWQVIGSQGVQTPPSTSAGVVTQPPAPMMAPQTVSTHGHIPTWPSALGSMATLAPSAAPPPYTAGYSTMQTPAGSTDPLEPPPDLTLMPRPLCPSVSLPKDTKMLPPPTDVVYPTAREAHLCTQEWALAHGYDVSIGNSSGMGTRAEFLYLRCYKGGPPPEEKLQPGRQQKEEKDEWLKGGRDRGEDNGKHKSRMRRCEFRYNIFPLDDRTGYRISIVHAEHNHKPNYDIGLDRAVCFSGPEREYLLGIRRDFPNTKPLAAMDRINKARRALVPTRPLLDSGRPISRLWAKAKAWAERQGAESLDAVLRKLQTEVEDQLIIAPRQEEHEDHISALFVVHADVQALFSTFPHVLAVDATYSVNRHGYPLVQLVAILPWGNPLPMACALVEREDARIYGWVFRQYLLLCRGRSPDLFISDNDAKVRGAAASVFEGTPTILCHWHVSQNVENKVTTFLMPHRREAFMREWKGLLEIEDIDEAEKAWADIRSRWLNEDRGPLVINYLERNIKTQDVWPKIAWCHTSKLPCFGVRTTSVVESSHSSLKAVLPPLAERKCLTIPQLLVALQKWWRSRLGKASRQLENDKRTDSDMRKMPALDPLVTNIAYDALRKFLNVPAEAQAAVQEYAAGALSWAITFACCKGIPSAKSIPGLDLAEATPKQDLQPACIMWTAYGVPCVHRVVINMVLRPEQPIMVEDFHPFNHLPDTLSGLGGVVHPQPEAGRTYDIVAALASTLLDKYGPNMPLNGASVDDLVAMITSGNPAGPSSSSSSSQTLRRLGTPPIKARTDHAVKVIGHNSQQRLDTQTERKKREIAAAERMLVQECGYCGDPGHRAGGCTDTGEVLAIKHANKVQRDKDRRKVASKLKRDKKRAEVLEAARRNIAARNRDARSQSPDKGDRDARSQASDDDNASPGPLNLKGPPTPPAATDDRQPMDLDDYDSDDSDAPQKAESKAKGRDPSPTRMDVDEPAPPASVQPSNAIDTVNADITEFFQDFFGMDDLEPTPDTVEAATLLQAIGTTTTNVDGAENATEGMVGGAGTPEPSTSQIELSPASRAASSPARTPKEFHDWINKQDPGEGASFNWVAHPRIVLPADVDPERLLVDTYVRNSILETEPNGNCGFDALRKLLGGNRTPSKVRLEVYDYTLGDEIKRLLPPRAHALLPQLRARLFPGGRRPNARGLAKIDKDGVTSESNWLSSLDLWIFAQCFRRIIVAMRRGDVSKWETYVPVAMTWAEAKEMDKPIGLLMQANGVHWEGCKLKHFATLPPIRLRPWGTKARKYVDAPTHKFLHVKHSFYITQKTAENAKDSRKSIAECGCVY